MRFTGRWRERSNKRQVTRDKKQETSSASNMIVYLNNSFLEEDKAVLQVNDLSILRGYGVFDFLRTYNGSPLFLEHHLDRFFHSASQMYLCLEQSRKELTEIILELARRNNLVQSGIRILLTGGYSSDGYKPSKPNLLLLEQSLEMPLEGSLKAGIRVISYEYLRELPSVKSTNYLMGVWLQEKIRERGAADVLYFRDGIVSEFPRANVFIVTKEGKLVTPARNILKGITRMKVLELARDKFEVEERAVMLEEVKAAAEVFMTSTTKRVMPVVQVDEVLIGEGRRGEVTSELQKMFLEMEEQELSKLAS